MVNQGGPVFVDMYGTSRRLGLEEPDNGGDGGKHDLDGPHPDGPFWVRALKGLLPLWVAFWFGFVFGHGIILAFSLGAILIGTILGMSMASGEVTDPTVTAWIMGGIIALVAGLFALWSTVSVWRCAKNAKLKKWKYISRALVSMYLVVWGTSIWNIIY